jgi:hypothetical protein
VCECTCTCVPHVVTAEVDYVGLIKLTYTHPSHTQVAGQAWPPSESATRAHL